MLSDGTRDALVRKHGFGREMIDIAERAAFKCEYCSADLLASIDRYFWSWERDHIAPTSAGGPDELSNWALACRLCNQLKGRWDPRSDAGDAADRTALVAAARHDVQQRRADGQRELAEVRALVTAEIAL